jgi:hypothetical protein
LKEITSLDEAYYTSSNDLHKHLKTEQIQLEFYWNESNSCNDDLAVFKSSQIQPEVSWGKSNL